MQALLHDEENDEKTELPEIGEVENMENEEEKKGDKDSGESEMNEETETLGDMTESAESSISALRKQEMQYGNIMNWENERDKVRDFCRWKMFKMIKFPTEEMLNFSVFNSKMSEDERYSQYGIICCFALEEFGQGLRQPMVWWRMVRGVCIHAIGKRRSSVVEGVKKAYITSKYYVGNKVRHRQNK